MLNRLIVAGLAASLLFSQSANAQKRVIVGGADTPDSANLRGAGNYLQGLGWYNLNSAKAESIQLETQIRWEKELRESYARANENRRQKLSEKNMKAEERKQLQKQKQLQLRANPTDDDIRNGDALNVLLYDLTDPVLTSDKWLASPVQLPADISVKKLVFEFVRAEKAPNGSSQLGNAVIALSRLNLSGNWPICLNGAPMESDRKLYEEAYSKLLDQILTKKVTPESIGEFKAAIETLRKNVQKNVPTNDGYRTDALKHVDALKKAAEMFHSQTVEYAAEIVIDTHQHEAHTVGELVAFTKKYRLQFADGDKNPEARELYARLYELMKKQAQMFGISAASEIADASINAKDPIGKDSSWSGKLLGAVCRLKITERKGEAFRGRFEAGRNIREISGTVKGDKLVWLAKDTKVINGEAGGDNFGTVNGDRIDFSWQHSNGNSGKYFLNRDKESQ